MLVAASAFTNHLQPMREIWEMERFEPFETTQWEYVVAVKVDVPASVPLPQTLNFTVNPGTLRLVTDTTLSPPVSLLAGGLFANKRVSNNPKEYFTGTLVQASVTAPVTVSLTINTRPAQNDPPIEVPGLKIRPNVMEDTAATPKKLVTPGGKVLGKNVLLTLPLMCRASGSNVSVSVPKPELNITVRNDETFEEYLRLFTEVQAILAQAGNSFSNFAVGLYNTLENRGSTPVEDVLRVQGEALWNNACSLVQNSILDDRPLYWARLQSIGAIRAFHRRNSNNLPTNINDLVRIFERSSRGLDAMTGEIKFPANLPAGTRKAIVTGFDPFELKGDSGTGHDLSEQSNASGLLALLYNGQPIDVPNQGNVYVRTAIFPVRFREFNAGIVEDAITRSLGSLVMLITTSQNNVNYYDIERWAARKRSFVSEDNNNEKGVPNPAMPPVLPGSDEYLESTLPGELAVSRLNPDLEGPIGLAPFVFDQSYKTSAESSRNRVLRRTNLLPPAEDPSLYGKFRFEPLKTDTAAYQKVSDAPTGASEEGSGSNFLSNEVFYRVAVKRSTLRPNLASGHIHVPATGYDPRGTGGQLKAGFTKALQRLFTYGFPLSGTRSIQFPTTFINMSSPEQLLTVTNNSTETLKINAVEVAAPFSVVFPNPSPLPITVAPGASATFSFKFTPTTVGLQFGRAILRELSGEILFVVDFSGFGVDNLPPIVSDFSPHVVQSGDPVTVSGQHFRGTTQVLIGTTSVNNFTVLSDTEIEIDAVTSSGRITIVTPSGSATSSTSLHIVHRPPPDL